MTPTDSVDQAHIYEFATIKGIEPIYATQSPYCLPVAGRSLFEHMIDDHFFGRTDADVRVKDDRLRKNADFQGYLENARAAAAKRSAGSFDDCKRIVWPKLVFPEDLYSAFEGVVERQLPHISDSASIEDGVEISGNVHIGAGTRILAGARIKGDVYIGKNCFVGNNVMIRGKTTIGNNSSMGFSAEVKNALVANDCLIGPLSIVCDSILAGRNFIAGKVRLSNYRLDNRNIDIMVDGKLHETGRRQFATIIGERTAIGIGGITLPGRKVGPDCIIGPYVIITKNLDANTRVELAQNLKISKIDA